MVTTGVPAARYWPTVGVPLADDAVERRGQRRVVELLPRELELGAALLEHRLAVAHFLERVLVAALGDLERRVGGVEVGARRDAALDEGLGAVLRQLGLVEHRPRLADDAVCSTSTASSVARAATRPSRARACCSAASAWLTRRSKSVGHEPGDRPGPW